MKRNMNLVRKILLAAEGGGYQTVRSTSFEGYDESVVAEHMQMLREAGLIEANIANYHESAGPARGIVQRLTWEGHEFLDATRSDTVWKRVTDQLTEKGLGIPLEVAVELAKVEMRRLLGLDPA